MTAAGRFDAIDHVLALDLGRRGIARFFIPGAAVAAAGALRGARRVLVVTGFCVPPGRPETDGPPGAAVLGRALRRLGVRVRYLTDPPVVAPLRAALDALGEPADIVTPPETGPGADGAWARALLARERPTHLVAVERPGRAPSGDYLSARGESIAAWNRPLDELFLLGRTAGWERRPRRPGVTAAGAGSGAPGPASGARATGTGRGVPATAGRDAPGRGAGARTVTVAVGDGGNEVGMGNVRRRLVGGGGLMARVASIVRVDHLVVAGASNWGAYGIVAALARLTGRPLLHTPALERRMLEACVAAGAVDGITRRAEATVDGLPLDTQLAVVELLARAAGDARSRRRPDRR